MAGKLIVAFFASALYLQAITAQYCGGSDLGLSLGNGFAANGLGGNYGCGGGVSGGSFPVTSTSPITPSGITVLSENTIEGPLSVIGNLPLLAAVTLEGQVPTNGQAGVQYGCGNGNVGITAAENAGAGLAGIGLAGGRAIGTVGSGCGCY